MAKKSGVHFDITQLRVMQSSLKQLEDGKYRVQVGIFGDKTSRKKSEKDITNAEIGLVHEMGSVSHHIPRRSFLWDTFTNHGEELMKTMKPQVATLFKTGKVDEYLKQAGKAAENLVREAFETSGWGAWPPNAYATIMAKLKGSLFKRRQLAAEVLMEGADHAKPLVRTGQLWQAIASRVAHA